MVLRLPGPLPAQRTRLPLLPACGRVHGASRSAPRHDRPGRHRSPGTFSTGARGAGAAGAAAAARTATRRTTAATAGGPGPCPGRAAAAAAGGGTSSPHPAPAATATAAATTGGSGSERCLVCPPTSPTPAVAEPRPPRANSACAHAAGRRGTAAGWAATKEGGY